MTLDGFVLTSSNAKTSHDTEHGQPSNNTSMAKTSWRNNNQQGAQDCEYEFLPVDLVSSECVSK